MKIAVFSTFSYDQDFLLRYNTGHEITFFSVPLNTQTAILTRGFEAVCVFVNDVLDNEVLSHVYQQGIRLIVLRCAGYNNVDVKAAHDLGMDVVRVPAYSPEAVAEHAIAIILTLNRKTHKAYNRVREGNFSLEGLMGFNLHDRKIAVIGTGAIGKAFCRILKGFGCRIHAFDIDPDESLSAAGVQYAGFGEVIHDADIVSLHCPLLESTRHLINEQSLRLFKKGAMLINTSRGGLINTADVIQALKEKRLGSLGIDVYEQESNFFFRNLSENVIEDDVLMRLISFPNVLVTSHQGFFTHEAMAQIATTTFENIDAFAHGKTLINKVTF